MELLDGRLEDVGRLPFVNVETEVGNSLHLECTEHHDGRNLRAIVQMNYLINHDKVGGKQWRVTAQIQEGNIFTGMGSAVCV